MSVVQNAVNQTATPPNDGVSGKSQTQLALELNSCRIIAVAEQLAMCAQVFDQPFKFHQLCLSLARGIDYGLANNEVPAAASTLPQVLKMVCCRKNDVSLQAGIMVLMISVKNACKLGWFTAKDTEELLTLADEVASYFVTKKDVNTEVCNSLPTVSTIMSRFYPRFKLGNIIASLEVEPGYGTHLVDFHISKDIAFSKEERIRLFVAMKDNIETSSCIITPQQVNILLNGKPVEHRNSVLMDHGPQLPTIVNPSLKYGINLLQVMGQFNGHYILIVALMSSIPSSDLQPPADYVQPASAVSSSDAEIIEGPSRVSLRCPISKTRIKTPVKGNSCKHYQCFDYNNYVEINFKRPSWRCPSCNQSVCFTDLRVDQKMVKALQEVGENVSEVIVSVDGTWTAASGDKHKDELNHKTSANKQEGQEVESSSGMDASDNMCDLTGEDDEMDTDKRNEQVDTKPVVHINAPGQSVPSNFTLPPASRSTIELTQYSSGQAVNSASPRAVFDSGSVGLNFRPHAQVGGTSGTFTGNGGITPVLTDAVSPALNRHSDNLQGTNCSPSSIYSQISAPAPTALQLQARQAALLRNNLHLRNFTRVSSAIQALPVPTTPQQHSGPTVSSPVGSGSAPFQRSVSGSNARIPGPFSSNVEQHRHLSQPYVGPHMSNMPSHQLLNRSASPGLSHSNPSLNMPMPQTLSQPPHLMRTSQLPRNHVQPGMGPRMSVNNSPSTLQRVQLTPQQTSHARQQPQTMPLQTQAVRMTSPSPLNSPVTTVTRSENLINAQHEHNWRPSGRMRGALTGKAYSDALNQCMGSAVQPVQTSSPRPHVSPASSLSPSVNNIVLLANRRIAAELQTQSVPVSGPVNTQEEGSSGVN